MMPPRQRQQQGLCRDKRCPSAFPRITRATSRHDIDERMRPAFAEWLNVVLLKPLHLPATIDTAMPIVLLHGLPLRRREIMRRRLGLSGSIALAPCSPCLRMGFAPRLGCHRSLRAMHSSIGRIIRPLFCGMARRIGRLRSTPPLTKHHPVGFLFRQYRLTMALVIGRFIRQAFVTMGCRIRPQFVAMLSIIRCVGQSAFFAMRFTPALHVSLAFFCRCPSHAQPPCVERDSVVGVRSSQYGSWCSGRRPSYAHISIAGFDLWFQEACYA